MRIIRPSEHKSMPWKNGGGVTREILLEHGAGDAVRYLYRLSIADVASDGPFSRFDGYERHIMLLEGAGMTLDCKEHGSLALRRFEPQTFSGDWDVTGALTNGPVRDLNLIVDRTRATASMRVRSVTGPTTFDARGTTIVHVLEGALESAAAGDTLVADRGLVVTGTAKLVVMTVRQT